VESSSETLGRIRTLFKTSSFIDAFTDTFPKDNISTEVDYLSTRVCIAPLKLRELVVRNQYNVMKSRAALGFETTKLIS
jgi:hypothetical protein